jgi:preprotein translocase subunit SecD
MICLSVACTTGDDAGVPCPAIEMSAVADPHAHSTRTVTLNDTTTIRISPTPVVATGDITGADAQRTGNQWVVNFTVTDDAAQRVQEFSKQRIGSNLALVVDGKVHGAPRITGAIVGNRYKIDGFNRADAERLASAITSGCRR